MSHTPASELSTKLAILLLLLLLQQQQQQDFDVPAPL